MEQLEFKLEKIIGIQKHAGKFRKSMILIWQICLGGQQTYPKSSKILTQSRPAGAVVTKNEMWSFLLSVDNNESSINVPKTEKMAKAYV